MNPPTSSPTTIDNPLPVGEQLERRLEELLHQERFAPPTHVSSPPSA